MEPLQVMPLDESFNLVSGPLDYESLQWNRKYYETGDFSMSVLSSDYDPSWAYIYTPFRPEMGIIQKVEFSDTSHTPDGKDTVTVSGFFMDWVLDRLVFLVEQTEQEKVIVPKPSRPSNSAPKPNLKQDSEGNLYFEYNEGTSSHHYNSVETGECIWPDQIEGEETWTDVPLEAGDGMSEQRYPVRDAQGNVTGDFGSGWYNAKYNYYSSDDGKLHVVGDDGEEATYDLVGNGTNAVVYKDDDGSYKWVWGVVEEGEESAKDRYEREVEDWEKNTQSLQVDDDGNRYYYRTVKGPWQLRTDINDVTTPQDNVQWVIKMAQKVFGNNFFYDEPDFSGETKILSPSLTRIGDFFRQELKTIEAGLRVFYSFKSNQMIFQVWRGLDRTQDENSPAIDDAVEQDAPAMLMAANEISTMSAATASLPSGYVELEYIESTGTQYINTGFIPNQDTRAVLDIESDEAIPECHVFGSRSGMSSDEFCVLIDAQLKWRTDYGTSQVTTNSAPRSGRILIDKNKATTTIGTVTLQNTAQTFSAGCPMYLFAINTAGSTTTFASVKLHSSQIYDNGTLVRDFTPARRVSDSAVGLYDSVNGQFYANAGSGLFLAGPNVSNGGVEVPDGYTQLEYVETDGQSYIDTGVPARGNYDVSCDFMFTGQTNLMTPFGSCETTSSRAYIFVYNLKEGVWFYDQTTYRGNTSMSVGTRYTVSIIAGCPYINGNKLLSVTQSWFVSQYTYYIMSYNSKGSPGNLTQGRIYAFSVTDGSGPKANMVPAKRDSDGAVGMYDTVRDTFIQGTGALIAGPPVVVEIEDHLTYYPNSITATGTMEPTEGYQNQTVIVAACEFTDPGRTFTGWNTLVDGTGTTYQPGSEYMLTSGDDALYAQWSGQPDPGPGPDVPDGNAWAVFSDKWGSLYDYSASVDDSNYRNLCYVLHEFDEPVWDDSGHPVVETITGELMTEILGYQVKYTRQRGQWTIRLEDDYEDRETWLDKRDEKPEQDQDWPRDMQEEMPDVSGVTKESYDQFKTSLQNEGRAYLEENYPIVKNLDTGTLDMSEYLTGFDLGDKVDMEVSTLGLKETARIIEVDEVHESGNSEIHLVMGEEMVTSTRKAGLN